MHESHLFHARQFLVAQGVPARRLLPLELRHRRIHCGEHRRNGSRGRESGRRNDEHGAYFPIRARSRSCFFSGSGVKAPAPGEKSHALVGSPNFSRKAPDEKAR